MTKFYEKPNYYGLVDKSLEKDKRYPKWEKQFNTTGKDDSYYWSFDSTILAFINNHLGEFIDRKMKVHEVTKERKQDYLNMVDWLKIDPWTEDEKERKKLEKGLDLLREYFFTLWI